MTKYHIGYFVTGWAINLFSSNFQAYRWTCWGTGGDNRHYT